MIVADLYAYDNGNRHLALIERFTMVGKDEKKRIYLRARKLNPENGNIITPAEKITLFNNYCYTPDAMDVIQSGKDLWFF